MKKRPFSILFSLILAADPVLFAQPATPVQQKTADGILEGVVSGDGLVRTFKGIPYAAPPVGPLRWKPPQPVQPWTGVRPAAEYGARAMQGRIFDDMVFHDSGPSEDCLYLNLWMQAKPATAKLPVMVWIHGGGLVAGASSEPRQDGGNLCKLGVLVVSMNYRLGIFGFLAHPELTAESGTNSSGNYGLMDQIAALEWVRKNIAGFGGDPDNVTIFGESAGSMSVSALMASPRAQGLFHRAIGESGAYFSARRSLVSRAEGEQAGVKYTAAAYGTSSLAALRAKTAAELLAPTIGNWDAPITPVVDGTVLMEDCASVFAAGRQSRVPLLAGWNRDEGDYRGFFGHDEPTVANFAAKARARFGADTEAFLKVYPATTDAAARRAAQDLSGDDFIAFGTWKWLDAHLATGGTPVYRYEFDQTLPLAAEAAPGTEPTAPHASDIEFVFRVLSSRQLPWRPADRETSELMAQYWTNFAKTGNPNSPGLPEWPAYRREAGYPVMHLQAKAEARPDTHRGRYELLDRVEAAK